MDNLLLESGDGLLLESGDGLLLEQQPAGGSQTLTLPLIAPAAVLSAPALAPTAAIIDDGDAGYSQMAGWTTAVDFQPESYGETYRYAAAGSGSVVATWQVAGLPAGTYVVQASWTAAFNRATDAPYRIHDDATLLTTVRVDQTLTAVGPSVGGVPFQTLAIVTIASGTLRVTLADDADSYAIADAVRFAAVVAPALPAIAAAAAPHAPAVTPGPVTLSPPAIAAAATPHAPALAPGAVALAPPALAAGAVLSAPALTPGAVTLALPAIPPAAEAQAPAVAPGPALLALPTIGPGSSALAPAPTPGAVALALPAPAAGSLAFAPGLAYGQTLSPLALAAGAEVYPPALGMVALRLGPARFSSTSTRLGPDSSRSTSLPRGPDPYRSNSLET
jgi:hypothetical protein